MFQRSKMKHMTNLTKVRKIAVSPMLFLKLGFSTTRIVGACCPARCRYHCSHCGIKHQTFCTLVEQPTDEEVDELSPIRICLECKDISGDKRKEPPMSDCVNKRDRRKKRVSTRRANEPLSPPEVAGSPSEISR